MRGRRKLILSARSELYDVAKDPKELTDLAARDAAGLARMREELVRTAGATGGERTTVQEPNAEVLEKLHAAQPALPDVLRLRATLEARRGELAAARRDLEAEARLLTPAEGRSSPESELAELLLSAGDETAARKWVDTALAARPHEAKALMLRGLLSARSGNLAAARRDFAASVSADPSAGKALLMLAEAEAESGDLAAALGHFDKALHAGPESPELLNAYAAALLRAGRKDRARELLLRSEALRPGQATVRELLGKAGAKPAPAGR